MRSRTIKTHSHRGRRTNSHLTAHLHPVSTALTSQWRHSAAVRAARLGRDKLQPALCVFDTLGLESARDVHAVAHRRTHVTSVKRHERQMHTLQALPDCLYQGNITPLQEKAVMYHAYSCTPNHAPAATMLQQQHNSHLSATRLSQGQGKPSSSTRPRQTGAGA